MNTFNTLLVTLLDHIKTAFNLSDDQTKGIETSLNVDAKNSFGDLSCNAAMVLARQLKQPPKTVALTVKETLAPHPAIESIEIAGPGFINIKLRTSFWRETASELYSSKEAFFKYGPEASKLKYLIEFVSANPTGPLHLGHGRGGIIGDVLARVLSFLGHQATREFYINDAGNQIEKLGASLKARCEQALGTNTPIPEGGYAGEYLIEVAQQCITEHGNGVIKKDVAFFSTYGIQHLLEIIKKTLADYGVTFNNWFSEKTLHPHAIEQALNELTAKQLLYEKDGALWFKSSEFGDTQDRVIKKSDGLYTYIAADIAYHKNKFDRGYDRLMVVLGQDHHGYVMRLKATMQALGYPADHLDVILYQLVSIKSDGVAVKMSKRAGNFTELQEVIDTVGTDVARFFYLNRKAEAHLDFDLAMALKKTDENPVYYIQYAYVRTKSVLAKAQEVEELATFLKTFDVAQALHKFDEPEITLLKKILALKGILSSIEHTSQTHLLSYYTLELAQHFHAYYAHNKIINVDDHDASKSRLFMIILLANTFETCLDLLGLSKPEKM